jgi:hypothetical protein
MLFTISDYQKRKGVSLQFITEYTKKGVFKKIDLPVFVEYQGEKIQVGKKRMLQVPPQYLPHDSEPILEAKAIAKQVSDDAEIQEAFQKMLLQSDDEERLRKRYDLIFNKNHPKHQAYKAALNAYIDIVEQHAKDLLKQAESLLNTVKNNTLV